MSPETFVDLVDFYKNIEKQMFCIIGVGIGVGIGLVGGVGDVVGICVGVGLSVGGVSGGYDISV